MGGIRSLMSRRVLLALLSAAVLVALVAQPGAAVNTPQAAVASANPADWTPHVLDGKVDAVVQVGSKMVAGGLFTRVANAATPTTAIARSNISAFDATTGVVDTAFAPVLRRLPGRQPVRHRRPLGDRGHRAGQQRQGRPRRGRPRGHRRPRPGQRPAPVLEPGT